jgi:preprotein translocase subunit SecA
MLNKSFKNNSLIRQYQSFVNQINILENELKTLTDSELKAKSFKLQKQYDSEQNLNALITEAFALTREASVRTLGLRHFDVQLLGGLVLNNQKIAEMKTGEGKTLAATLPAFLNAITKKGVHIVTVNDYLANRDQTSMGQIYRFLGLETGLIQEEMALDTKKESYKADITYVTNYQVTFDFLRDNLALDLNDVVLRPFNYCIIDEVDSILIDEAQNPLLISTTVNTDFEKYVMAAEVANFLIENRDFTTNKKNRTIIITEEGNKRIERILQIPNLYARNDPWIGFITNAIRAILYYKRNINYIILNDQIVIVDEFSGRIMPDRRWGNGLHQAIEAKEKITVSRRTQTVAAITYQNFFLLYPKLSGMTGTGKTAEVEFEKIYNLSVDQIPTAQPNQRKDLPDLIYKNQFLKWDGIAETCYQLFLKGQPILIGTKNVENSELLGSLLDQYELSYQILNAKPQNVRKEATIIAQAGRKGTITIATNMAGRGTDILLGGNIIFKNQKRLYDLLSFLRKSTFTFNDVILELTRLKEFKGKSQKFINTLVLLLNDPDFLNLSDFELSGILREGNEILKPETLPEYSIKLLLDQLFSYDQKLQKQENKLIKNLGGLFIIGTERNDSARVDDQLRGRCARQGDPGISRFFLSLDDTLLSLFGGSKIKTFMNSQSFNDLPLESEFITKSLDAAQIKIEERAYQERKNLFDYDDILNQQRNIFYYERKKILESASLEKKFVSYGEQIITELFIILSQKTLNLKNIISLFENFFLKKLRLNLTFKNVNSNDLKLYLFTEFWLIYHVADMEMEIYGDEIAETSLKDIILLNTDNIWSDHIQKIGLLKEAVSWRGYSQRNPLYEYKEEAYALFESQKKILRFLIIARVFKNIVL